MEQEIKKIVDDLVTFDPGLAGKRDLVSRVVTELVKARPNVLLDESFKAHLRAQLRSRIAEKQQSASTAFFDSFAQPFTMNKFSILIGGFAVLALAVVSTFYFSGKSPLTPNSEVFVSGTHVTKIASNAFGKLAAAAAGRGGGDGFAASAPAMAVDSAPAPMTVTGPDNQTMPAESGVKMSPPGFGIGGGGGGIMPYPYPEYVNYRFVYDGDALELTDDQLPVLRRVKRDASAAAGLVRSLNLGLVDLDSFASSKLQNFTLAQDTAQGYIINVNLEDGSVNISENWLRWDHPENRCQSQDCYEQMRVKPGDVPADDVVIGIARQFLTQHGIGLDSYGEPFVQDVWRAQYAAGVDASNIYIPDVVSVVFPVVVDGQMVYDEGGTASGLIVSVSIRTRAASGVWGLTTQNYESSAYAAEKNSKRVLDIAARGGFHNGIWQEPGIRTVEIKLGEPKRELVKIWNYKDGISEELLVPSLVFPVLDVPADQPYFRKTVIVPLVADILDSENAGGGPIMPMMEKNAQ